MNEPTNSNDTPLPDPVPNSAALPVPNPTDLPAEPLPAALEAPPALPPEMFPGKVSSFRGAVPSLALIGFSIIIFIIDRYLVVHYDLRWMFEHSKPASMLPGADAMPAPRTFAAYVLTGFYGLAALSGILISFAGLVLGIFNKSARDWLEVQLGWLASRPIPAIHLLDVAAIFMFYAALHPLDTIILHSLFDLKAHDMIMPAMMLANDLAMAGAVMGAVVIATWRGHGSHGASGFWPAWSDAYVIPKRPIWQDILLGLICYPLVLWIAILVGVENKFMVNTPDKHFIILEIARHPRPLVAAIYILTGTLGAAFFEETLFRGILYNALRRILGGRLSALLAAFLFAWVHGLKSDILGLFVLGLTMTWLYDKTGRLLAGMTFHFTNNLVSLVLAMTLYSQ